MPKYLPSVSFSIWSEFIPAIGKEELHCDMRRGFKRARKKEIIVESLLKTEPEAFKIGHWVQKAIYELVTTGNELEQILDDLTFKQTFKQDTKIIYFQQEDNSLKDKITNILYEYNTNPRLEQLNIINISPGDEGILKRITLEQNNYKFNLFYAFDCLIQENNKLHILDIKTGKSDFDLRQGYVYLLAAQQLYPDYECIASFYNVQTGKVSDILTATKTQLLAVKIELAEIAKRHQEELKLYRYDRVPFSSVYPPNPGYACYRCEFISICQYSCLASD